MSKTILAIAVVGALEFFALYKGIDGKCLGIAFAILGGLGGYSLKHFKGKLKKGQ